VEKGGRKGSGGPVIASRSEAIQCVSFPVCHGAEAPRNDGLSPGQAAPASFFGQKARLAVADIEQGKFLDQSQKISTRFENSPRSV
jgi:hypothetical protein